MSTLNIGWMFIEEQNTPVICFHIERRSNFSYDLDYLQDLTTFEPYQCNRVIVGRSGGSKFVEAFVCALCGSILYVILTIDGMYAQKYFDCLEDILFDKLSQTLSHKCSP